MTVLKLALKLKNRMEDLDKLNQAVEYVSTHRAISKKTYSEINLVLEELFTNIIQHGCCRNSKHSIDITISLQKNVLTIQIEDDGIPFNPITANDPERSSPLENREIGGLGIFLAKHYTEFIKYKRRGSKNILTLKRKLIGGPDKEKVNGNN